MSKRKKKSADKKQFPFHVMRVSTTQEDSIRLLVRVIFERLSGVFGWGEIPENVIAGYGNLVSNIWNNIESCAYAFNCVLIYLCFPEKAEEARRNTAHATYPLIPHNLATLEEYTHDSLYCLYIAICTDIAFIATHGGEYFVDVLLSFAPEYEGKATKEQVEAVISQIKWVHRFMFHTRWCDGDCKACISRIE